MSTYLCIRRCLAAVLMILPQISPAQTTQYGTSGPWTLFRNTEGGQVQSCHATMAGGAGTAMIFDYALDQTSIGFAGPRTGLPGAGTEVEVWFDGDRAGSQVIAMPPEGDWRVYRAPNSEPDGLLDLFANASVVSFTYMVPGWGEDTLTFTLQGSNAMTKRTYACVQDAQAGATPATTPQRYDWVAAAPGLQGPGIVSAGNMPDGLPVFVCAVHHQGGYHPGMTGVWTDRCSIGYGGAEHQGSGFFYLSGTGRWRAFDGTIPVDAVEGGQEADGRKLYICRVQQQGAALAGKYRPGFRGCNIGDGGSEISIAPFDLLTF